MLRLLARRARAQWLMVAAMLAVVTVGSTLLGIGALLVTRTAERAVEVAASRAGPEAVDVTAFIGTVRGADAGSVITDTRALLTSTLAPFNAATQTRASTVRRTLPATLARDDGVLAQAYLAGIEDLPGHAELIAGRWPRAGSGDTPYEAVLLEPTARALGVTVGARVPLGGELDAFRAAPVEVTVVGLARPLAGSGWDRDPLGGAGVLLADRYGPSAQSVDSFGPFILDLADVLAGGSTIDRLDITARPDLADPHRRDLDTVTAAVGGADRQLARILGDRVQIERVASPWSATMLAAQHQQRVTTATVLALALLGGVLTGVALALAGRLTTTVRSGEHGLLSALGLSGGQLALVATVEAGTLALLGGAIAVPASSWLHAALTRRSPLAAAGLATDPGVSAGQLLVVLASAVVFAAVLVVLALRPAPSAIERRRSSGFLARTGADLILVAFAAVGFWQLATQPSAASARADAIRIVAPALLLAAGAALALRLIGPALSRLERLVRRARGLALPLAAAEAARRPQAVAAGLLIGLTCAAGTFAIAFEATWLRAQHDQADLSVGTDLVLSLSGAPVGGQGAAIAEATGGTVSPAIDRGVAVGQWLGRDGDVPRLVAVDTTRAGSLLRGRLDDRRMWTDVAARLAPSQPTAGIAVPAGAGLTLAGTASGPVPLIVTPELLLEDESGLRTPCTGAAVRLDGRPHELPACSTVDGQRLVAVSLPIDFDSSTPFADWYDGQTAPGPSRIAVTLHVSGAAADAGPGWTATSAPPAAEQLDAPAVALAGTPTGTELRMTTTAQLFGTPDAALQLVATAFPVTGPVPVAVSERFAGEIGAHPGSRLTLTVGLVPVPVEVTEVVETVPSAPGAAAMLADLDALSRALVGQGELELPVDAWWVGEPTAADAADRVRTLHLGPVITREGEITRLTAGPLRAGLPAALRLLVPAAALLLLAGVVLHVTCDLEVRALEVARLRGLGMPRRQIRGVLLGEHAGVLFPLLVAGAAVGALASWLVTPLLIRSETGAAPYPSVLAQWPWSSEAAFLGVLVALCTLAVALVVTVQVRRADAAHLRVAS